MERNLKTASIVCGAVIVAAVAIGATVKHFKDTALESNWTFISLADNNDKWYIDATTFQYEDHRYTGGWIMLSQAKADPDGTRSIKVKTIFDCVERKYRFIQIVATDGVNGHGVSTGVYGVGPIRELPPNSNLANVADFVCKPIYNAPVSGGVDEHEEYRSEDLKHI